jgi:hypothetical protein
VRSRTPIKDPHFAVYCDECGSPVGEEEYGGPILYETRAMAIEDARDNWEWAITDDGKVTYESCFEERVGLEA